MVQSETQDCINSILTSQKNIEYNIVVIDNGSSNDSFKNLKLKNTISNIIFLDNSINLGFAKANNKAFVYAKYNLKSSFIIMINNDTTITDTNFLNNVIKKYEDYDYYVLGPDILTIDGYHQNPIPEPSWNNKNINTFILKRYLNIFLGKLGIVKNNDIEGKATETELAELTKKQTDLMDVPLHGACLIFSPNFIDNFDGLYPNTFLYMEEDFLRLYSKYFNFLMMFSSDLMINHKERISSKSIAKNKREVFINRNHRLLESMKKYKRVYKETKKNKNLSVRDIEEI